MVKLILTSFLVSIKLSLGFKLSLFTVLVFSGSGSRI